MFTFMDREIKFRAWDAELKIMHPDVSPWRWDFVISNSWHRCEKSTGNGFLGSGGDYAEMLVPAVRFTNLMQYTGLKDKNGNEIYEGDIVKARGIKGVVKWFDSLTWDSGGSSHPGFYCEEWLDGGSDLDYSTSFTDAEIIGNIYEHKHLIDAK